MHLQTVLVLPCVIASALAETHTIKGSFSKFKAVSSVEGRNVTERVYESCKELEKDGKPISNGKVCVSNLLKQTLLTLTAALEHKDEMVVLIKNNTVLEAQPTVKASSVATLSTTKPSQSAALDSYGAKPKREDDDGSGMLLKRMNDRISQQSRGEHTVRVVQVGTSEVHPKDGIAVRTNVHSDGAVLHVHTNGSHATAAFKRSESPEVGRRDEDLTQGYEYRFANVEGIKMQLRLEEGKQACDLSSSDLSIFASAFGYGNGDVEPAFMKSDLWTYAVCDNKDNTKLLQGKLISEADATDLGYEGSDESVDCK